MLITLFHDVLVDKFWVHLKCIVTYICMWTEQHLVDLTVWYLCLISCDLINVCYVRSTFVLRLLICVIIIITAVIITLMKCAHFKHAVSSNFRTIFKKMAKHAVKFCHCSWYMLVIVYLFSGWLLEKSSFNGIIWSFCVEWIVGHLGHICCQ